MMQRCCARASRLVSMWRRRWVVVGAYVGVATVGVFVAWYLCPTFMGIDLSADGHTPVTLWQLRHWETCAAWDGFKARARAAGPCPPAAPQRLCSGYAGSSKGVASRALALAVRAAAGAVAFGAAAGSRDQCRCRRALRALPAVLLGPAREQGTVLCAAVCEQTPTLSNF